MTARGVRNVGLVEGLVAAPERQPDLEVRGGGGADRHLAHRAASGRGRPAPTPTPPASPAPRTTPAASAAGRASGQSTGAPAWRRWEAAGAQRLQHGRPARHDVHRHVPRRALAGHRGRRLVVAEEHQDEVAVGMLPQVATNRGKRIRHRVHIAGRQVQVIGHAGERLAQPGPAYGSADSSAPSQADTERSGRTARGCWSSGRTRTAAGRPAGPLRARRAGPSRTDRERATTRSAARRSRGRRCRRWSRSRRRRPRARRS